MNGPESFTPDTRPLLGESPFLDGFHVAAGFNSTGMMSSAGAGRVMAQWIVGGEAPMDLWDMDIARFDRAANAGHYLAARVAEAVGEVFQVHWPWRQPRTGRGVRRSPLHGYRTGRSLCFAYVRCEPGTPRSALLGDAWEIDVAGERFPLRALTRPAYDPDRARLLG